jgi:hypothetical protein
MKIEVEVDISKDLAFWWGKTKDMYLKCKIIKFNNKTRKVALEFRDD